MCGIVGILARNATGSFDEDTLRRMVGRIRHRGPDESAVLQRGDVGLGISRLAIIDPGGSHQPISNEDRTVFMVFNGEIYNYKQLRSQLEDSGHVFATKGDGEAIVHGYEEWGDGVCERLRGMFAIAIWDEPRHRLLLVRDGIGIKPLYYHDDGNRLVFASEIKAMTEAGVEFRLREDALDCHLAFRYVPAPDTMFENIHKLAPGEYMTADKAGLSRTRYHRLELRPKFDHAEGEAIERLSGLFAKSVEYRLQSDVPLGVFLSGGLDSGFLLALTRKFSTGKLNTFTIGFNRGGIYDETSAAEFVARRFATTQHSIKMDHAEYLTRLPSSVYHMDEPMADPSAVPMQAISELARRHVTVVLSGEGGDELFAGYHRHLGEYIANRVPWPETVHRWLARRLRNRVSRRVRRGVEGIGIRDAARRHFFWQEIIVEEDRKRLLKGTEGAAGRGIDPRRALNSVFDELVDGDDLDRLLYFDMTTWLPEDLLLKKDKMGMSASIEARVPFLDQDVVEYALKLPISDKIRGTQRKYILRRLLEDYLPREILNRPKVGFDVPISSWFRHELSGVVRALITDERGFLAEALNGVAVGGMMDAHARGLDLAPAIYSLLVLELWGRIFLRGESPDVLEAQIQSLLSTS